MATFSVFTFAPNNGVPIFMWGGLGVNEDGEWGMWVQPDPEFFQGPDESEGECSEASSVCSEAPSSVFSECLLGPVSQEEVYTFTWITETPGNMEAFVAPEKSQVEEVEGEKQLSWVLQDVEDIEASALSQFGAVESDWSDDEAEQ